MKHIRIRMREGIRKTVDAYKANLLRRTAKKQFRSYVDYYRAFQNYFMSMPNFPVSEKDALSSRSKEYLIPALLDEYRKTMKQVRDNPEMLLSMNLCESIEDSIWQYCIRQVIERTYPNAI